MSFTVPPQYWEGVPLTGQAWLDQVAPFIDRFSPDVEWWSPANEPGLKGWTFTPTGAAMVADFSVRLKSYLEQGHPADRLLSPDFNDHYNSDGTLKRHPDGTSFVERYVKLFDKAGGQFGSAVAWHPYGAVRRKSFLSTDDLVTTLSATSGAGLPIWVTEAGARASDTSAASQTEAEQDAQVKWMTDTELGAGLTRPDHPDALLQHARRARHRIADVPGEGRFPLGYRPGPGVRREAAGVVHVVPRLSAERRRVL